MKKNVLLAEKSKKEIKQTYIWNNSSESDDRVTLVKTAETKNDIIRIMSTHCDDYYFINCLHSFRKKTELKSQENVSKDYDYCHVKMPEKFWKTNEV